MKFSYALIKKLSPRLPAISKVVEASNLYSFEVEEFSGDLIDIALPANRYSDAASHIGIAREVSAALDKPFKSPVKAIINPPSDQGFLKVEVENKAACPRYSARVFEIKKLPASPAWMKNVFKTCGLKPINGIVDLTNYVMLETGQPLHAFDADKIAKKDKGQEARAIIVRKAKNGEKMETLDGQRFELNSNDLVIADSSKALGIAGIKGGLNSGVDGRTRRIIIEAATFDPVRIFKTSKRLKLITDASIRFSHGLSPELAGQGMDRITELLVKSGAKLVDSVDIYPKKTGDEIIGFSTEKYSRLIGAEISAAKAKKIFMNLGFSIVTRVNADSDADKRGYKNISVNSRSNQRKSAFLVRVPAWRTDMENPEDLIEEAARFVGYNKMKPQMPTVALKPAQEEDMVILKEKVRRFLVNVNLNEVYNHSFSDEGGKSAIELENPISSEFKELRQTLQAGLLKNVADNGRFFDEVRIFEIGKVFRNEGGKVRERLHLGISIGAKKKSYVLELKGIFEDLLKSLGFYDFHMSESVGGETLQIESGKKIFGGIKTFNIGKGLPAGRQGWVASVGEVDLDAILPVIEEERAFKPLPKYPAVMRDISVLLSVDARIGEVMETIGEASSKYVEDVDLIDEYVDKKFDGKQSLTFRIIFQSEEKTLTDAEVDRDLAKIISALKRAFKAEVR
ncbi:MAG TPA: phenylalanine--tRNA ligase subunit beta [Candidatus Paceibacterota bacterium]|nr:phenylalanine--tRNA ligase subunit beta [Candidatus Paceibacterota bacterium]